MENKEWSKCHVSGSVTTCDPGQTRDYIYPKSYSREEITINKDICGHHEHLPCVVVKEIGPDFIEIEFSGKRHKLTIGKRVETPKKGLSYAYSQAIISLE